MDILLIAGHGAGDPGACGCGYEEADLTREVVEILADKLQGYADISVYPMDHSAYHDLHCGDLQVNWTNYDYVLEVHFNAFNGEACGTEIYTTRIEEYSDAEECIMDHMGEYFDVRGVKEMNFDVIYSAKRAGVSSALLEVCFIDNEDDMETYVDNTDGVVQSIADGIIEGFHLDGSEPGPEPEPEPEPTPEPEPEPEPGGDIAYIQSTLNNVFGMDIAVDDEYGPETHEALVKALQIELNDQCDADLDVDGIFGPETKSECPNVHIGHSGWITWLIQAMLVIDGYNTNGIDGIFGAGTMYAVKDFQGDNGLFEDGIVGKNTFEALFG